jgi:hypothetical protein
VRPWIVVAVLCLVLAGCSRSSEFHCTESAQCGAGRCEPNGFCSVPDPDCPGGFSYDESAGMLATVCVEDEPDAGARGVDATSALDGGTPDATGPTSALTRDECAEGAHLPADYSACTADVCRDQPGCCTTGLGWDEACVQAVERSTVCARSCSAAAYASWDSKLRAHTLPAASGGIEIPTGPGRVHAVAAADYDGDRRVDLALATPSGWTVIRNETVRSAPLWRVVASYPNPNTGDGDARRIAWADWDRDGDLDLAVGYERGGLALVRHDPGADPPFVQIAPAIVAGRVLDFDWGDVDADGDLDLVAAHDQEARLFRNDGAGGFTLDTSWSGLAHFGVRFCDVTGDSKPEVVASSYIGQLYVYPNEDGLRDAETTVPRDHGENYGPLACADLDGDGDRDVAAAAGSYYLTLRVYRNRGLRGGIETTPAFATTDRYPVAGLDAGDVDGDRDLDLVIAWGGALQIMENTSQDGALTLVIHEPLQGKSDLGFDLAPRPAP